jgi:hypothetical protein
LTRRSCLDGERDTHTTQHNTALHLFAPRVVSVFDCFIDGICSIRKRAVEGVEAPEENPAGECF